MPKIDDIDWIICERGGEKLCFYMLAPYLHEDQENYYAKLIYKTVKPFKTGNILKQKKDENWYKTIHLIKNNKKKTVSDSKILKVAKGCGFRKATGFWQNLNVIPKNSIFDIITPPNLINVYKNDFIHRLATKLAKFYESDLNGIKLTGSAGFFNHSISELNDLDIIIKVNSLEQLAKINREKKPQNCTPIKLKEKYWPLRWMYHNELIICPYFIYGDIDIPIVQLRETPRTVAGKVKITNSDYGIFNVPLYECSGVINKILIKSTFIRGIVENDMVFNIDCPVYEITEGSWKGCEIAIFRNSQIESLKNLLYLKAS